MKKIILGLIILLISGCAASPQKSALIGTCKKPIKEQHIWEGTGGVYAGRYLITSNDSPQLGRMRSVLGELSTTMRVKVVRVLKDWDGSYGPFLRVEVEIIDGPHAGLIADVPACVPYHPRPRWIELCTLDPNALVFNDEVVKDCKERN